MTAAASAPSPFTVLLVEDDDADVALVEDYFDRQVGSASLRRVVDGVEALEYLRREGSFADGPRPDIIVMDLNMPRMDGRELLHVLKQPGSAWASIPVIVFTTSSSHEDVANCYRSYANAFVIKALTYDAFQLSLGKIHDFFGRVASLDKTAITT